MKTFWHNLALALSLLSIASSASAMWAASADNGEERTALRSQSLDVSRAGSEVTRRLFVTEERSYSFAIRLKLADGDRRGDKEACDPSSRLIREVRLGKDGDAFRPSLAIPLRLKISVAEAAGERIVIDREIDRQQLDSVRSDTVLARIGKIDLPPGFYRLSILSRGDMIKTPRAPGSVEISWVRKTGAATRGSDDMTALLAKIQTTDLLNHLANLEQVPLGTTEKFFLRAETFSIPDALGVLDPCSHRVHLHRESGNFWIVRRCEASGVSIFHGVQPGLLAATRPAPVLAFKLH